MRHQTSNHSRCKGRMRTSSLLDIKWLEKFPNNLFEVCVCGVSSLTTIRPTQNELELTSQRFVFVVLLKSCFQLTWPAFPWKQSNSIFDFSMLSMSFLLSSEYYIAYIELHLKLKWFEEFWKVYHDTLWIDWKPILWIGRWAGDIFLLDLTLW